MVSIGWQVTAGGVPLAIPTLSHSDQPPSTSTQHQSLTSRPRSWVPLSSTFPLHQVSQRTDDGKGSHSRALSPLLVPTNAKAARRDLNADCVILATLDDVHFRVSRALLVYASPVFRKFFSNEIGQLRSPNSLIWSPELTNTHTWSNDTSLDSPLPVSDEASSDGTRIVYVPETGKTLDSLLQFLYPRVSLESPLDNLTGAHSSHHVSLDSVKPVLFAAHKYGIRTVVQEICSHLLSELSVPISSSTTTSPSLSSFDITTGSPTKARSPENFSLRVYAIACSLQHRPLAEASAYASLRNAIAGVSFSELDECRASHYFYLLEYHRNCGNAAVNVLRRFSPLQKESHRDGDILTLVFADLLNCSECHCDHRYTLQRWWEVFVLKASQNLLEAPRTQVIYSANFHEDVLNSLENEGGSREFECIMDILRRRWNMLCVGIKETVECETAKVSFDTSLCCNSRFSDTFRVLYR